MLTRTTTLALFPERSVNFYSVLSREINETLCSLDVSPKQRSAFTFRQSRLQNNRFKKWRTFQELGFRFIQPLKITLVKSTYPTGQHPKIPSISNTLISLGKTHIIASVILFILENPAFGNSSVIATPEYLFPFPIPHPVLKFWRQIPYPLNLSRIPHCSLVKVRIPGIRILPGQLSSQSVLITMHLLKLDQLFEGRFLRLTLS